MSEAHDAITLGTDRQKPLRGPQNAKKPRSGSAQAAAKRPFIRWRQRCPRHGGAEARRGRRDGGADLRDPLVQRELPRR